MTPTAEQLAEARRYHLTHYGIPRRPIEQALASDYHTLAEELSLEHAGVHVPHARRSLNEAAHKLYDVPVGIH